MTCLPLLNDLFTGAVFVNRNHNYCSKNYNIERREKHLFGTFRQINYIKFAYFTKKLLFCTQKSKNVFINLTERDMHKNIIRSWHLLCVVGCLMITLSNPVAVLAQTGEIKLSAKVSHPCL